MNKDRRDRLKLLSGMYARARGVLMDECVYCGSPREVLDHVPPLKLAVDLDLEQFAKRGGRLELFPACGECNSKLSAKPLYPVENRIAYLWEQYAREIDKRKGFWAKHEMDELGPGMQSVVHGYQKKTEMLIRKLRGIEARMK